MTEEDKKTLKDIFKERKRVSVNFKLAVVIIVAGIVAIGAFILLGIAENRVVSAIGDSKSVKENSVNERFEDFEEFIRSRSIRGDDTDAMQRWLTGQAYTELVVSDEWGDIFVAGSTPIVASKSLDRKKDLSEETQDLFNREMKFADNNYYVYMDVYMEYRWKGWLDNIKLLLSALIFLVLVLVYNRRVLKRIIRLSDEVNLISEGELDREINAGDDDEIGTLAQDVDAMRTSILETMNNEKAAWDANTQLITSMSHDIRTPLTSLIGYLDIISGHKYNSEEELNKYIKSCSDKAVQLKDLSDKLFQYFLVYNNKPTERELETVDAGILFQQLLIEHISELTQYDYEVDLQNNITDSVMLDTETSAMQRLFDNLFSNMMKYADSDHPIEIKAHVEDGMVSIVFGNHIAEVAKKVESTKIGVKTCKKIVEDHGGTFHALEDEDTYTTEIFFPVKEIPEASDESQEKSGETAEDNGVSEGSVDTERPGTEDKQNAKDAARIDTKVGTSEEINVMGEDEVNQKSEEDGMILNPSLTGVEAAAILEEAAIMAGEIQDVETAKQEMKEEFEEYLPESESADTDIKDDPNITRSFDKSELNRN